MIRTVELFAGAGGMALGAARAGLNVDLAVEADERAAATYRRNHPNTVVLTDRIDADWSLASALESHRLPSPDVILGGPPCQGWSTLGARSQDNRRQELNACVEFFVEQVRRARPKAFIMENVRGLFHADGGQRLEQLLQSLAPEFRISSRVLRAADYGVPQLRHRLFVVGIGSGIDAEFAFPPPSHKPEDYVTVADAIDDLPAISSGESSSCYAAKPRTPYQVRQRGETESLTWHEAPDHADSLVELLSKIPAGSARSDLVDEIRPSSGFHNTYGRLEWTKPAAAVTAAVGRVSSGRHTHPRDHRALSPREAARLQGFPDSYEWLAKRWAVYRMVGNAVPPDLAEAVIRQVVACLSGVPATQESTHEAERHDVALDSA